MDNISLLSNVEPRDSDFNGLQSAEGKTLHLNAVKDAPANHILSLKERSSSVCIPRELSTSFFSPSSSLSSFSSLKISQVERVPSSQKLNYAQISAKLRDLEERALTNAPQVTSLLNQSKEVLELFQEELGVVNNNYNSSRKGKTLQGAIENLEKSLGAFSPPSTLQYKLATWKTAWQRYLSSSAKPQKPKKTLRKPPLTSSGSPAAKNAVAPKSIPPQNVKTLSPVSEGEDFLREDMEARFQEFFEELLRHLEELVSANEKTVIVHEV